MNQDQQLREAVLDHCKDLDRCARLIDAMPQMRATSNEIRKAASELRAVLTATQQAAPYGYCPICGANGEMRERRMDGNDTCANGHNYKSSKAVQQAAPSQGAGELGDLIRTEFNHWIAGRDVWPRLTHEEIFTAGFKAALLEASTQREQPAASKPEPQAQAGGYTAIERLIKWHTAMADEPNRNEAKRQKHRETAITLQAMREAIAKKDAALKAQNEALEVAKTGLEWYRSMCPNEVNESDDEADAQIDDAITQAKEELK